MYFKNIESEDSGNNENLLKECTTSLDLSHHWVPGDIRVIMKHLDCHQIITIGFIELTQVLIIVSKNCHLHFIMIRAPAHGCRYVSDQLLHLHLRDHRDHQDFEIFL